MLLNYIFNVLTCWLIFTVDFTRAPLVFETSLFALFLDYSYCSSCLGLSFLFANCRRRRLDFSSSRFKCCLWHSWSHYPPTPFADLSQHQGLDSLLWVIVHTPLQQNIFLFLSNLRKHVEVCKNLKLKTLLNERTDRLHFNFNFAHFRTFWCVNVFSWWHYFPYCIWKLHTLEQVMCLKNENLMLFSF